MKRTNQRRPIIVDVASPDIKPRGVFALDLADDETARMVARKIAAATGRRVTLRDADMIATDFLDLSRCLSHSPVSVYRCPIVQRDDGLFQIGTGDDAPGPFESRNLAAAVAFRRSDTLLNLEAV
ncbi:MULTISPECIES: hypothetical protein [Bradyrhizobium]|uniref:hypothetical protein n=1 Tax=Bradyrhizobium TaxID=374 RepID=UPI0005644BD1|nr:MULTISPECIES: hypothetical protein [unclassified Bradyrhizobium]QIG98190.1 hypothetical protein G6P99_42355 [Bradyrhizobium sp. 6(2017)]